MKKFIVIFIVVGLSMGIAIGISLAQTKSKTLQFSWSQTLPSATEPVLGGWRLYKATTAGGPYTLEQTVNYSGSPQQTYTSSKAIAAPDGAVTTYYFVLTAFSSESSIPESAYSNEVNAVIDFQAPPAPTNFKATVAGINATITWNAVVASDLAGYRLYISQTSGFTPSSSNLVYDGTNTSFAFGGQTGKTYYMKLCAYDGGGNQSPFQDGQFQTQTTPSVPVGLTVTVVPQ